MFDLTPIDIRQKQYDFSRQFRGFARHEVAAFLDTVAEAMERLVEENRMFAEQIERLEELNRVREEREQLVVQALTMAEELREESRESAEREAALLIRRAQNEAHELRLQAAEALEAAREELRRLHARRSQLIWSFRSFLQHELGELESLDRSFRARAAEAGFSDLFNEIDPSLSGETPISTNGTAPEAPVSSAEEGESPRNE